MQPACNTSKRQRLFEKQQRASAILDSGRDLHKLNVSREILTSSHSKIAHFLYQLRVSTCKDGLCCLQVTVCSVFCPAGRGEAGVVQERAACLQMLKHGLGRNHREERGSAAA